MEARTPEAAIVEARKYVEVFGPPKFPNEQTLADRIIRELLALAESTQQDNARLREGLQTLIGQWRREAAARQLVARESAFADVRKISRASGNARDQCADQLESFLGGFSTLNGSIEGQETEKSLGRVSSGSAAGERQDPRANPNQPVPATEPKPEACMLCGQPREAHTKSPADWRDVPGCTGLFLKGGLRQ